MMVGRPLLAMAFVASCSCHVAIALVMRPSSSAATMRRAIELSNRANADPSFAEEACSLWSSILDAGDGTRLSLPPSAMSAAHGMHASTLVRIGRDKEAVVAYKKSLALLEEGGAWAQPMTRDEGDIRLMMGRAFQRMLLYDEAADVFLEVAARCTEIDKSGNRSENWLRLAHSESVSSAALCFMRVGNRKSAMQALEDYDGNDAEVNGMYGVLLLMELQSKNNKPMHDDERFQTAMDLLRGASEASTSPLFKWMYLASQNDLDEEPFQCKDDDTYLLFANVNNFIDDPSLINLDDKIMLHSLIDSCCVEKSFWPKGFVLPQEYESFLNIGGHGNKKKWILKERSGYGSHGNSIASADEVTSMYGMSKFTEPILCQRIVEPPMLLDGRKFSLRIYVVYFPLGGQHGSTNGENNEEVYISTEGLAKFASASFSDNGLSTGTLDDQYLTNSGRVKDGKVSQQSDLHQLRHDFERSEHDYDGMWESIEESVRIVMKAFAQLQRDGADPRSYAPLGSIPKILGYDFILDASAKPFLLEVNRFPGLEPRSSTMDADVKRAVVYDAWVAAADRIGMSHRYFQALRPPRYKGSSLKRLR